VIRVIGGSVRGKKLKGPRGTLFRPTTGRVKEYIYNVLGEAVKDAVVLDLFSGSGSLGIEALSRGAESVTFVELDAGHARLLEQNLSLCRFSEMSRIYRGNVFNQIERMFQSSMQFDLILADPPFKEKLHQQIVVTLNRFPVLSQNGLCFIEHEKNDPADVLEGFDLIKDRAFGHMTVSLYAYRPKG
jgi:16S rRNA (guanine966-N2)-methyltransferase